MLYHTPSCTVEDQKVRTTGQVKFGDGFLELVFPRVLQSGKWLALSVRSLAAAYIG